jgi:seryl-tRNA synthetase
MFRNPGQNTYKEISSCSNLRHQAPRFDQDQNPAAAKPTSCTPQRRTAVGRDWLAILENFQQADGKAWFPKLALRTSASA